MVHTVPSLNGGIFSVLVDGFNTTNVVDTYSERTNLSAPACYPLQFPPFIITPPDYQDHNNHTLTLVYIGPSPYAPAGANNTFVQFDSFAIPDPASFRTLTSDGSSNGHRSLIINIFFVMITLISYAML